jgi:catechol 2,3-dioxygenase-like lactoylglutathione lyase family enzyme
MPLLALSHVNIRTPNLEVLASFYCDVLGLVRGPRPAFDFPGAWLYLGDAPVIHLVGIGEPEARPTGTLRLEHFAFSGEDIDALIAALELREIPFRVGQTPGFPLRQVSFSDPDGNRLHVDFELGEQSRID